MSAGLVSLNAAHSVADLHLELDDRGAIRLLSSRHVAAEMFQSLIDGQKLAASLHPDDVAFFEQTRGWFAGQRACMATIRLRLRRAQDTWWQVLATFRARPGMPL